ncbi:tyrosine-protein kinase BAZ1B [Aplysia californica]|uniref:Tyrosine-protein kinase BAZ1B n=1 Tax=Aplysia californica TaxID=6500 RepID=A0ABM0JKU7_APLCA|nr:tyrosine-protein kinase BAZ1B [Aplysia californica]
MPLLGKKVFALGAQSPNNEQEDAPYLIPHTKERFQSKTEYEKRLNLYAQLIWTCRATGHTCLTHEEACKSEQVVTDQLKSQFPKCFEKEVLSQVHHSILSLDSLVDKTWWTLHQQFVVGEKVSLKVKVADKLIPAKIVGVDSSSNEAKSGATCNSPSSDKENSSEEKDGNKSPKKWVPPKFLPYTYSIELENEAKIIHSVPAADLMRDEKAPSKDLLRLYIRVSAIRSGTLSTSPWVVNADLVKQYKLISKFADFFLSPMKMADAFKKAEETGKKRKLSNGMVGSAAKKLKLEKSSEKPKKKKDKSKTPQGSNKADKNSSSKKKKNLNKDSNKSSAKKTSPSKKAATTGKKALSKEFVVVSDSDSDADVSLAQLKKGSGGDSDEDKPLFQLAGEVTPKKKQKKSKKDDDDVPLSKILSDGSKKASSKNSTPLKKSPSKVQKKNEKTPTKKGAKQGKDGKEKSTPSKKKGGLKQVTLYDLTKKGKMMQKNSDFTTPQKKSPGKAASKASPPKPPPTPAIVRRLLSSRRETMNDRVKYSLLLKKAVSVLTSVQVKNLPPKLKQEYERKKALIEEKTKMEKMSAEEKEAYLKEKRERAKKVQKQKMLEKMRDQRKRFEDSDLSLTPLPSPKLVSTPDGFPNELFGDVAMVTEFINCYGGLLMPDSEYPIYTDALMKALVGGSTGFTYLSRVLTVLLQTLLQDQIAEEYKEFRTQLSDVAVSSFTASELVRLCLRDNGDEDDGDVPQEYIQSLHECEFYQLDLEPKLCVLKALCSRVLDTYSVQDYMEEQQGKASALWKEKTTQMKQLAAQKKSQKQTSGDGKASTSSAGDDKAQKKDENRVNGEEKGSNDEKDEKIKENGVNILTFYGKEAEDSGEEGNNWGSIVKRRRVLAAKAAAEKEQQERQRAALREKEYQEEKKREKERKRQEQMDDAISLARMVLRQDPIGTDRNHDRYWVFTNTTPGLYVEKGWIGDCISYSVGKLKARKDELDDDDDVDESSEDEMDTSDKSPVVSQTGNTPLKVVYKTKKHFIEKSAPHSGQNLWFTYKSQKDLDGLLKALHPQGIRESLLKTEIKKRYDDMSRAIIQAQRMNLELRDSDGDVEMVAGFKKELSDMELRLRNGGLGGVPKFDAWESRLMDTKEMSVMGKSLLEVKEGILDKFLQGFMKPVVKATDEEVKEEPGSEEEEKDENGEAGKSTEKEDRHQRAVREWSEAVEQCQSMSRLHVLMAVLDTCIKWEKSAENAKCKICRKKCDDDRLLLCDECNQAFHMYCLRPTLAKLPSGDWFCPACKPRRPPIRRPMESESDEEEEEEKEDACRECGGSEKLVVCSKCPAAFHTQCHDPPLRHPPRGVWECSDCKNGLSGRRRGKFSRRSAPKKNYRQDVTASEEEESEEEEEEEEEEQPTRAQSRSRSRRGQSSNSKSKTPQSGGRSSARSRSSGQRESPASTTPQSRQSRRGPSELSLCEDVLARAMKHKSSWPFLEPVDKKQVPDYHLLIKKPMDFQTMQKKCARLSYASPQEFIEDAALVFENAESYNKPDSEVFQCMREVEQVFKDLLKKSLPDWPYYRTVVERGETSSGSEGGRRRSRNK